MNSEIIPIFSVPIGSFDVADKEKISEVLEELDLNNFVQDVSENYLDDWSCSVKTGFGIHPTKESEQWINVFLDIIIPYVNGYVFQLKDKQFDHPVIFGAPWINIYEYGDSQELHSHLGNNNIFSYCYFHKIPEKCGKLVFVDDNNNNQYLGQGNQLVYKTVGGNYVPEMKEGRLIIFPSWLKHFVSINRSQERRITISGNIRYEL